MVGDVGAGHEAIPWEGNQTTPAQTSRNRRQALCAGARLAGADLQQGYAP